MQKEINRILKSDIRKKTHRHVLYNRIKFGPLPFFILQTTTGEQRRREEDERKDTELHAWDEKKAHQENPISAEKTKTEIPPCIWCLGVFYKLVNYILFKGCLLGRFSTSCTASFCFSSTYIARYVHTWKTKIYCTIGKNRLKLIYRTSL